MRNSTKLVDVRASDGVRWHSTLGFAGCGNRCQRFHGPDGRFRLLAPVTLRYPALRYGAAQIELISFDILLEELSPLTPEGLEEEP